MSNDLVKRLRYLWEDEDVQDAGVDLIMAEAADRIEELQDVIARIQCTNLRRDMNLKNRTLEIDKLCKTPKKV